MKRDGGEVRIAGGEWRGRRLAVPKGSRPTSGRVREALFSIWNEELPEARFLDLFAGSGVTAFEAIGRGALSALCIDSATPALRALEANRRRLGAAEVEVRSGELPAALASLTPAGWDLVFADPPYRFDEYRALLVGVAPLLAAGGVLAIEHSSRRALPASLEEGTAGDGTSAGAAVGEATAPLIQVDRRRYGESSLSFYRRTDEAAGGPGGASARVGSPGAV